MSVHFSFQKILTQKDFYKCIQQQLKSLSPRERKSKKDHPKHAKHPFSKEFLKQFLCISLDTEKSSSFPYLYPLSLSSSLTQSSFVLVPLAFHNIKIILTKKIYSTVKILCQLVSSTWIIFHDDNKKKRGANSSCIQQTQHRQLNV